jgi:thiol:disulfide interchange protein DsbA
MISRRSLLWAGALAPLSASALAAQKYTPGKEYLLVDPPAENTAGKVDVVLFFAYTCPHCLRFEPVWNKWAKTAAADVNVRVCPVAWQPKYEPFADTYFALEALGLLDKLSEPFFESVIYQTHSYDFGSAAKDIRSFMVEKGVDGAKWDAAVSSFGVKNKTRRATALWQAYQIDSTPMVGVGGRYSTGAHLVGTREATPACIDYLVDLCRKQNRG